MFFDFKDKENREMQKEMQEENCCGETHEESNDGGIYYEPIRFVETKEYLRQVRNAKYRVELLENRIRLRSKIKLSLDGLPQELEREQQNLNLIMSEVAEEISKLGRVQQEMVMTKRYIDTMTWDEIAADMDMSERTIQKIHGRALPWMEAALLNDGLIKMQPVSINPSFSEDSFASDADDNHICDASWKERSEDGRFIEKISAS